MRDTQEAAASKAHVVAQDHPWSPTTTAYWLPPELHHDSGVKEGYDPAAFAARRFHQPF
jgi:hypothetical protein